MDEREARFEDMRATSRRPGYVLVPAPAKKAEAKTTDPCIRAENEDDDGYDPYSDRKPEPDPFFERDPWE